MKCSPSLDIVTRNKLLVYFFLSSRHLCILLILWHGVELASCFHPPTPPVLMGNVRHVLSVETAFCTVIGATLGLSPAVFRDLLMGWLSGSVG